jgi:hypothetical protein
MPSGRESKKSKRRIHRRKKASISIPSPRAQRTSLIVPNPEIIPSTAERVYLDPDVAYLLGMVTARGTIHVQGDVTRIIIEFPYRNLTAEGIKGTELVFDQNTAIRLALESARRRIAEVLGQEVDTDAMDGAATLSAVFTRRSIPLRNLDRLLNARTSYHEFEIHSSVFDSPVDVQREFMRGVADTCASPSPKDNYMNVAHRIVLQIQFGNWKLPIQLCRLLQTKLEVPVQNILWGHPNLRSPGGGHGWAKETRLRIFAEKFLPIGFYFDHKQRILEQLAGWNQKRSNQITKPCNPLIKRIRRGGKKPRHPDESDSRLPLEIRGRHFHGYFQVCLGLGCTQGKPGPQGEIFEGEDVES